MDLETSATNYLTVVEIFKSVRDVEELSKTARESKRNLIPHLQIIFSNSFCYINLREHKKD